MARLIRAERERSLEALGERQRLLQMWQHLVEQVAFAPAERLGIGRTVEAKRDGNPRADHAGQQMVLSGAARKSA